MGLPLKQQEKKKKEKQFFLIGHILVGNMHLCFNEVRKCLIREFCIVYVTNTI